MIRKFIACWVLAWAIVSGLSAAEWYVAPAGTPEGEGTRESPWDIETALGGGQKVAPGDTIRLLGGTYRHPDRSNSHLGYVVRLSGQEDQPIQVRGERGARVTIDGGLSISPPSNFLHVRDLEILVSENLTQPRRIEEPGSHPKSYNRPHGGLSIHTGAGCRYINLVIHDTAQGVSFWSAATDSELYGCLIYDNGWDAPDRGHGHAIYTQNQQGIKTIADCIMTGGYGYTLHAYGSERAYVDHYLVKGNICYDGGKFLIGGGRPSKGIQVLGNYLYNVSLQLGYAAPHNVDCVVRDNVVVNGTLTINKFQQVVEEGNLVLGKSDPRPAEQTAQVVIRPNRYDPDRCHVAIFNWRQNPTVGIPLALWLKRGDAYRVVNPRDFYGERKSGTPLSVLIPAPVSATAWRLATSQRAISAATSNESGFIFSA